jgi:hypothetical protein
MELFRDKRARRLLMSITWSRLRMLDPALRPWGLDETTASVDSQLLEEGHFLQGNFHGSLWEKGNITAANINEFTELIMV